MPKCNKIKNPCKICLGPVTQKNGLQCQGACQSWVHYSCLNYTPGKIKDIKAGIIKITCPCPDCKSALPREYRTDEPFSCTNNQCPANHPPKCGNTLCPINNGNEPQTPASAGCALDQCGKSCKPNSYPRLPNVQQPPPLQPCAPPNYPFPGPASTSSDSCLVAKGCPPGCSSDEDVPGDRRSKASPIVPSLGTLEQMCDTVGQLTNQINSLMAKMQRVVREKNGSAKRGCSQKGPKAMCRKPCYCPGNPEHRK